MVRLKGVSDQGYLMITVTIQKTGGTYSSFTCAGHAGYARLAWIGQKDILCSAVSALVINTVNALEALTDAKMKVSYDEKAGIIKCRFLNPPGERPALLVDALVLGLQNIKQQYGTKYLEVNFKEV